MLIIRNGILSIIAEDIHILFYEPQRVNHTNTKGKQISIIEQISKQVDTILGGFTCPAPLYHPENWSLFGYKS